MTPAAVAYPPLYASGGPAGGQTVAFDPREQGDGLRPKPLPHSGSVSRSEGIKRLSRHKRCLLRATPHLFHGSLDPLSTRKPGRRTTSQAARGGVFSTWPCLPPCLPFSKRAVGPFLAGAGRRAESSAFRSTAGRQRAEGEASARCFTKNEQPTGQRYVTKTARISYLYCVSYLY